jgi:transcriptional regulator with XRE-family HTH domain
MKIDEKVEVNENNINEIIAQNIKIARRIRGLTLREVGAMLGITGQQVQKYETGKSPISVEKLIIISGKLEIPLQFFFNKFSMESIAC